MDGRASVINISLKKTKIRVFCKENFGNYHVNSNLVIKFLKNHISLLSKIILNSSDSDKNQTLMMSVSLIY